MPVSEGTGIVISNAMDSAASGRLALSKALCYHVFGFAKANPQHTKLNGCFAFLFNIMFSEESSYNHPGNFVAGSCDAVHQKQKSEKESIHHEKNRLSAARASVMYGNVLGMFLVIRI
jgi:hypothetical protein